MSSAENAGALLADALRRIAELERRLDMTDADDRRDGPSRAGRRVRHHPDRAYGWPVVA